MTTSNEQLVPVERIAVALEKADWSGVSIGNKALVQAAIAALRTPPAVEPDEGLVRDIRNQIHAIMAGLVDTVGLIDKNPPGPFAVSKDVGESVRALQQVSLKLATLTPSIRAQSLEEAAFKELYKRLYSTRRDLEEDKRVNAHLRGIFEPYLVQVNEALALWHEADGFRSDDVAKSARKGGCAV